MGGGWREEECIMYMIVVYRTHYERLELGQEPDSNGLRVYCNCCLFVVVDCILSILYVFIISTSRLLCETRFKC